MESTPDRRQDVTLTTDNPSHGGRHATDAHPCLSVTALVQISSFVGSKPVFHGRRKPMIDTAFN